MKDYFASLNVQVCQGVVRRVLGFALPLLMLAWTPAALAVTYDNTSVPFNWIDASGHTKLGPTTGGDYSPTYKFRNTGGCGSNPPSIDDSMSDNLPLGFSFMYGGVNFTQVRIMSNGRLQFNDNTTCGYGSPVTQLPYPNASLDYTMRIYGGDLDPSLQSEIGGGYVTNCASRASCYVSYATLGTAPYRSFVVTWNHVPEWTSFSSATGSYDLQVILQENGEFIYQYGANTPGPGFNTGQVGWQVSSTTDYDVPQVGYPASNSAIKFYIPRPVAEYRMEQPGWSGTPNEVFDTSGNGRHGVRVGSAQTTAGKVCRGADIPNNTSTAIDAIDTGISIPGTVGGQGTITFWYDPSNWASNLNQDAQLFDASIANNEWFFLVKERQDNSHVRLRFTVRDSVGTTRSVETANLTNSDLAAGWVHIAVTWNFNALAGSNNDRLRIYVNGALAQTSSFTSAGSVSNGIGTLYVGDNRSSFSEANGTSRSANGVIDEFRIYNYEGGLALVQRDMSTTGDCLGHYAISHAGTARACEENNVTVTAHTAGHGLVVMPNNTTQITLGTSTGKGDWTLKNGYGVLNNGAANDGIATYLFNGEYQAVFGLTHTTPGTVSINVTDGQIVEGEDPDLTLTSCVAVSQFNACHDYATSQCKAAGRLYTRLAGTAFDTDVLALDSAGIPDSGFTGKAVVSLIARATTGSVDAQNCFAPDYTQVLDNAVSGFSAGRLTLSGKTVPKAYRDVRIKVVCDATNCPPSGITACSTDNFAIRPSAFTVSSTAASADVTGSSGTATPTIKAGAAFDLIATAVSGYNGTPLLDSSKLAAHGGAVQVGALTGAFSVANVATGVASGNVFTYGEVGYFRLNAAGVHDDSFASVDSPADCTADFSNAAVGGKFGCKFGNTAASTYFGRFIPDHFDTAVTPASGVGGFTYSDQPFPLTVSAKNSIGGSTANYAGSFAKTATLSDANSNAGSFRPAATIAGGRFVDGVANLAVTPSVAFRFTSKQTAPATIKVRVADGEANSATGTEETTPLRSGRLRLINAYGSELLKQRVEYRAEYWDGSRWATNTLDSVTSIIAANIATGGLSVAGVGALTNGLGFITFNVAAAGGYDIAVNLNASGSDTSCNTAHGGWPAGKPWLQGFWSGSCGATPAWDQDPNARIRLGSPKAPYIYLRERF